MEADPGRSESNAVPPRDTLALVLFVGLYLGRGVGVFTFETTLEGMLVIILLYQVFS